MAFIPVPLDLEKETRGEVVEFLEMVGRCGRWPQQACTPTLFSSPKNVVSERPIALMPTMIRWWEALQAPCRFEWDATGGRDGGAERTDFVGVVVGGFHHSAGFYARVILDGAVCRQEEHGDVHDVLGVLGDDRSCCPGCAACSCVVVEGRVNEDDVLVVYGR